MKINGISQTNFGMAKIPRTEALTDLVKYLVHDHRISPEDIDTYLTRTVQTHLPSPKHIFQVDGFWRDKNWNTLC